MDGEGGRLLVTDCVAARLPDTDGDGGRLFVTDCVAARLADTDGDGGRLFVTDCVAARLAETDGDGGRLDETEGVDGRLGELDVVGAFELVAEDDAEILDVAELLEVSLADPELVGVLLDVEEPLSVEPALGE